MDSKGASSSGTSAAEGDKAKQLTVLKEKYRTLVSFLSPAAIAGSSTHNFRWIALHSQQKPWRHPSLPNANPTGKHWLASLQPPLGLMRLCLGPQRVMRSHCQMILERDAARAEAEQHKNAQTKLQSLCRELQKQNKAIQVPIWLTKHVRTASSCWGWASNDQ